MRYLALACDYDGTLAEDGQVDDLTLRALDRLRASGRRLLLVTGRELEHLHMVFPETALFDAVVAENGAHLYLPASGAERLFGEAPPEPLIARLQSAGVELSVGRRIVTSWQPHEGAVRAALAELGLPHQVSLNRGAVMALPPGVDKAAGLRAALGELGLPADAVVGVGDAETDLAFLSLCACAVAVQNALPVLKQRADLVTEAGYGAGVAALIDEMIDSDLGGRSPRPRGRC